MDARVRKVFIIGGSLFAEAVRAWLHGYEAIAVVGLAADVAQALEQIPLARPDVVLCLSDDETGFVDLCPLLAAYPDLPILRTSLLSDELGLICHRRLGRVDLVTVIRNLPVVG